MDNIYVLIIMYDGLLESASAYSILDKAREAFKDRFDYNWLEYFDNEDDYPDMRDYMVYIENMDIN